MGILAQAEHYYGIIWTRGDLWVRITFTHQGLNASHQYDMRGLLEKRKIRGNRDDPGEGSEPSPRRVREAGTTEKMISKYLHLFG